MSRPVHFTVDARLLRELGVRLVGRPHIALGELIKNSYDADATEVVIRFDGDSIEVTDNGHGMTEETFINRWMRIGTAEKLRQETSPLYRRDLTGSKGVGRLAAQLLARSLRLETVALEDPRSIGEGAALGTGLSASIDWVQADRKKDLSDVTVDFDDDAEIAVFANGSPHGTRIVMTGLLTEWGEEQFRDLAQEIWALQPPFEAEGSASFAVKLDTPHPNIEETFRSQMSAILDIASARITGKLIPRGKRPPSKAERILLAEHVPREDEDGFIEESDNLFGSSPSGEMATTRYVLLNLDLAGYPRRSYAVEIADCQLHEVRFDIRIFDLVRRQPQGIRVGEAREYLAKFGGVHLYDNAFRLPYYGPDNDWLNLEIDHARRISRSRLLPEGLQVQEAMQDLPSNKRVYGAAYISTSVEQRLAKSEGRDSTKALAIQISRDRLASNQAFSQLAKTVRLGIDLYAVARTQSKVRRVLDRPRRSRADAPAILQAASQVVENLRDEIPSTSYTALRDALDISAKEIATRDSESRAYASLLGSLATAGMASLAYEHELAAQRGQLESIAQEINLIASGTDADTANALRSIGFLLSSWSERSQRIRALFRPLLEEEDRSEIGRYRARALVGEVVTTLSVLARSTAVDTKSIPADLMLPPATYTAWSAVVQNILMNAYRATLERKPALVKVDGASNSTSGFLRFQDNGVGGVDIRTADRLFLPFERAASITERAAALGMGGSGLGLTIVKMIADEARCDVGFVEPEDGWSTAIRVSWGR